MKKTSLKDYTKKIVKEKALKCRTREEFSGKHYNAFKWAKENGCLEEICENIPRKTHPGWTEELIRKEASLYSTKTLFAQNAGGAYDRALKITKYNPRFFSEICSHMVTDHSKKFKHTKESAFLVASKFKTLKDFHNERNDVVAFLRRNGCYKEATKHMISDHISFEEILKQIQQYEYWDELKKENRPLFHSACHRKGWSKSFFVPKYIKERPHPLKWDKKMVLREMKKYKTHKNLLKNKAAAYQRAINLGLIVSKIDPVSKTKKWTKKNILSLCKKYSSFGELIMKEGNAPLNAAHRLGFKLPIAKVQYCGETYLKAFLSKVLEMPFQKKRPTFLKNPKTGRNLELDGFNEKNKIAFEHSGNYHLKPAFGRSLEDIQYRDRLKKKLCKANGVKLIITQDIVYDYKMDEDKIKKILKKQFIKLGIPYNENKLSKCIIFNKRVKINTRKRLKRDN